MATAFHSDPNTASRLNYVEAEAKRIVAALKSKSPKIGYSRISPVFVQKDGQTENGVMVVFTSVNDKIELRKQCNQMGWQDTESVGDLVSFFVPSSCGVSSKKTYKEVAGLSIETLFNLFLFGFFASSIAILIASYVFGLEKAIGVKTTFFLFVEELFSLGLCRTLAFFNSYLKWNDVFTSEGCDKVYAPDAMFGLLVLRVNDLFFA